MKWIQHALLLTALLAAGTVRAADLTISDDEQQLLDIRVQEVSALTNAGTGELTLRVRFAPDGEWVIKTPLPGVVHRVFVQEGDRVKGGDPLLVVRSADMVGLQRDFLKARAELELQRATLDRDRKLADAGSISQRRWQETRYNFDAAEAEFSGLQGRLMLAGFSVSDLERLGSDSRIGPDLTIRAPCDAIILDRPVMLGDQLDGTEALVRLGQPNKIMLQGVLAHSAAVRLAEGAELQWMEGDRRAELVFVSDVIDPQSQTVQVRAKPLDPSGLVPGQLTRWRVLSGERLLTVPSSAVVKLEGKDVVFLAVTGGFDVREVEVRNTGTGAWIVLAGLEAGDRIAATGTAVLKGMSMGMGGGDS
jgi:cobalt-zinc-cadmium efflux system membrane fusion protein